MPEGELLEGNFDIRSYLRQSDIEIIDRPQYQIPDEFNLSSVSQEYQGDVEMTLGFMRDYLQRPIVKDNFENHDDRRKWEEEATEKVEDLYGRDARKEFQKIVMGNPMGRNSMASIIGMLQEDETKNNLGSEQVEKVLKIYKDNIEPKEDNSDAWGTTPFERKLEVIKDLSQAMADIANRFKK